jgi:hypothetical protein
MREGLIDIVQADVYGPLHVRPAAGRHLSVVTDTPVSEAESMQTADDDNIAALAQPAQPDENEDWDPEADASALSTVSADSGAEAQAQDSVTNEQHSATMPAADESPADASIASDAADDQEPLK